MVNETPSKVLQQTCRQLSIGPTVPPYMDPTTISVGRYQTISLLENNLQTSDIMEYRTLYT